MVTEVIGTMNDNKVNKEVKDVPVQGEPSKSAKEAIPASATGIRKILSRKWAFPAVYMAAAAIILTLMWVYQDAGNKAPTTAGEKVNVTQNQGQTGTVDSSGKQPDNALSVNAKAETMKWPVTDRKAVEVVMPFYDNEASSEQRQSAMLEYNNSFMPSTGISLSQQDGKIFDVVAAMSGKVTRVANLPLVGNVVEITHDNGLKTVYQSLTEVSVAEGDQIKQGDVIAKAGRNELEKAQGVHLHFEILQNDKPVNPEKWIAVNK